MLPFLESDVWKMDDAKKLNPGPEIDVAAERESYFTKTIKALTGLSKCHASFSMNFSFLDFFCWVKKLCI